MAGQAVMAVDVGTGSARTGLFDPVGRLLGRVERPIVMQRPLADHAEHDSEDIWRAVGSAARAALAEAGIGADDVVGISFDATCSLVALDREGRQVSVSTTGEDCWNTIVWMDHRAIAEAEECTASGHAVLSSVGGVMSPEMEIPKLMWLKRHRPEHWQRYGRLLDLADFLTFRASGSNQRSCCTLTCKWTYLAHEQPGWQADFLSQMGLDDLFEKAALPGEAAAVGASLGNLTVSAAADLGLTTACEVGVGLIDAHAGALAALGPYLGESASGLDRHIGLIAGTSTCHMALSSEPRAVPGVWGPYFGAVTPDLWLNEGGQSATGALLDHILAWHGQGRSHGDGGHDAVLARIAELCAIEGDGFADRLHVLPDFHGNRSPLADPHAVGVISGLTLDSSFDSLARLYYRTAVGIALGTRHILEALNAKGYAIDHLHVAGGHTKNPLLMALYADTTGCKVIAPAEEDVVLLGTAIVAARAAGLYPDLGSAAAAMASTGDIIEPNASRRAAFDRDYRIFLTMHRQRSALDRLT
ncbi:MAG: FGGY-family carbohydrate kinase [Alphaproteobacteria bacterium]|nr:FGGY-family carbohydrate kinase [Alphaproteobacteria bacterium]